MQEKAHIKKTTTNSKGPLPLSATAALKITALVLPFAVAVAAVNYTVDPGRLYNKSRQNSVEIEAVGYMLEGYNVTNLVNYDERLLRREYLNQLTEPKDVIVMGSSRGAQITAQMLQSDSVFNLSVARCQVEDMIGFYGVLREYNLIPKKLVISLDPWLLNDSETDSRWKDSVGDGYYSFVTEVMGIEADSSLNNINPLVKKDSDESEQSFWQLPNEQKLNLFSPSYFQASVQRLSKGTYKDGTVHAVTDYVTEYDLVRSDGSYSYPFYYRDVDTGTVYKRAAKSLPDSIQGLEDYASLDSGRREVFEQFIECVQADGVEIEFVMFPLNPALTEHMAKHDRYDTFFELEDMYRRMAAERGIIIAGSFDPANYALDLTCFLDGFHLQPNVTAQIMLDLTSQYVE